MKGVNNQNKISLNNGYNAFKSASSHNLTLSRGMELNILKV